MPVRVQIEMMSQILYIATINKNPLHAGEQNSYHFFKIATHKMSLSSIFAVHYVLLNVSTSYNCALHQYACTLHCLIKYMTLRKLYKIHYIVVARDVYLH